MTKLILILAPLILSGIAFASKLVLIQTLTSSKFDDGMIWPTGKISLDICDKTSAICCQINDMLSPDYPNNFGAGVTDNFTQEYLQGCSDFEFAQNIVGRMTVWHAGADAWKFDFIKLTFEDERSVVCPGGQFIDNEMSLPLECAEE